MDAEDIACVVETFEKWEKEGREERGRERERGKKKTRKGCYMPCSIISCMIPLKLGKSPRGSFGGQQDLLIL